MAVTKGVTAVSGVALDHAGAEEAIVGGALYENATFMAQCCNPLCGLDHSVDEYRWTATRHCLIPVLSRSAKTSFPGRGPLRCAPWSFPPGVGKLTGQVSAVNEN